MLLILLQTMSGDKGCHVMSSYSMPSASPRRTLSTPSNSQCGRHCLNFTNENTEAQRGQLTYLDSHSSKWYSEN